MKRTQGARRLATVTIPAPDLRPDGFLRHASGEARGFWARETALILHDLDCFLRGAAPTEWRNRVDKAAGY